MWFGRLHADHYRGADAAADAPLFVFVHGTASCSERWYPVIRALLERGLAGEVWALNLPGYGISPPLRIDEGQCQGVRWAAIHGALIAGVVRRICRERGGRRVTLVGHSLGGYYCVWAAALVPDCIAALRLEAPVGILPTLGDYGWWWAVFFAVGLPGAAVKWTRGLWRRLWHYIRNPYIRFYLRLLSQARSDHYVSRFIRFIGPFKAVWSVPVDTLLERVAKDQDIAGTARDGLSRDQDIAVLYGEHDRIIPWHQCMALPPGVHGSVMRGAGHSVAAAPDVIPRYIRWLTRPSSDAVAARERKPWVNRPGRYGAFPSSRRTREAYEALYIDLYAYDCALD